MACADQADQEANLTLQLGKRICPACSLTGTWVPALTSNMMLGASLLQFLRCGCRSSSMKPQHQVRRLTASVCMQQM